MNDPYNKGKRAARPSKKAIRQATHINNELPTNSNVNKAHAQKVANDTSFFSWRQRPSFIGPLNNPISTAGNKSTN